MLEDFLNLFGHPLLAAAAQAGGLLLARILPLVLLTPMFGGQVLPQRLRIGISFMLVLVLLPAVGIGAGLPTVEYLVLLAKEVLVGLTLSTMILIMYHTFTSFGAFVDLLRGATIANIFDPITQQQESLLGSLFLQFGVVLFLTLGGARFVIEALADSLLLIRPGEMLPSRLVGAAGIAATLDFVTNLFLVAVRLAAPVLAVILLLDIVLGLLNRVAPQIQVYFLGLTVKPVLALLIVLLGLGLTFDLVGEFLRDSLETWYQWLFG